MRFIHRAKAGLFFLTSPGGYVIKAERLGYDVFGIAIYGRRYGCYEPDAPTYESLNYKRYRAVKAFKILRRLARGR